MIEQAVAKDYEQIYQLGNLLHENFENKYNFQELQKESYFHLLVYKENDQVLGFLSYVKLLETVDILDIVVDEQNRHQKIATNLIDYMISGLNENDAILLEVGTENQIAISLYEKFGFKIIHTRKKYYGKKDAYVMERVVNNERH